MTENVLKKVSVLIPSLDPDEQLVQYVYGLREHGFKSIIIVNDGSGDSTLKFFDEVRELEGVTVLKHAVNQGKGRALKTGFNYFLNSYTCEQMAGIVTADADGQHSVEDTVKVAMRLIATGEMVLGTRNFNEPIVPMKSRIGNKVTTVVFSLLYGKKIQDTQTGLRGIPYFFVRQCLCLEGERFDYEIVMLIQATKAFHAIFEEPIETIYIDSNRATHFHAVYDSIRIYRVILQMFLRFSMFGLLSFIVDISLFDFFTKILFAGMDASVNIFCGTLIARGVSSFLNYLMNRTAVFLDKQKIKNSLLKYYGLCIVQLLSSWLFVVLLSRYIHLDTTLIKSMVDLMLFFVSYQIQRLWVFKRESV